MIPLQVEEFIVPLQSKPRAARFKVKKLLRSVQMRQSAFKVQSAKGAFKSCYAAGKAAELRVKRLRRG